MLRYLAPETTVVDTALVPSDPPKPGLNKHEKLLGPVHSHISHAGGAGGGVTLAQLPTESVEERSMCSFRKGHNTHLAF